MKIALASLAALSVAALSFAQVHSGPATSHASPHQQARHHQLVDKLNLTDQQKAQIRTENQKFKVRFETLRKEREAALDRILTPAQRQQLATLKAEAKAKIKERVKNHTRKGAPAA